MPSTTEQRQLEAQSAQQNPNILNALSGASLNKTISPQVSTNPIPALSQKAGELSGNLYGSGFVQGVEGEKEKMLQELFNTDMQVNQAYQGQSPFPQEGGYVSNPADLVRAYATQGGNIASARSGVAETGDIAERRYQTAVTGVLDTLGRYLELEERRKDREEERKAKQAAYELQLMQAAGGGQVKNPYTGEMVSILAEGTAKKSTDVIKREEALRRVMPVLERVTKVALTAPEGVFGYARSQVGKLPGVEGGPAEYLSRDVEGFARLIASVFASEVGVATDADVERWKNLMPRPGDTMPERIRTLQQAITQIENEMNSKGMEIPPEMANLKQSVGLTDQTQGGNMVPMQSPEGQSYNVPIDKVTEAEANGWRRL